MTRSRLIVTTWLLLIGISNLACSTGTETGNPPAATVSFGVDSSNDDLFSIGSDGAGVQITAAHIGVQQLAFTECNAQAVTEVAQAVTIDLRDGESVFDVPPQQLCAVELSLESRDIDWADVHPGSDTELSFGIAGLTTLAAPLFIEDDATPAVVFRPAMFDVTPGSELLLSLDVATALSFDEVGQTPPDNDGEVVITGAANEPVLANIRQRWASSWSLYAVTTSGGLEIIATGEAQ
jgi:hypothetical protein